MSFLRRTPRTQQASAPAIQLKLKWRNGSWHFFNIWFYEPVMSFKDLEEAELYVTEHRINHYELEGVGQIK